MSLSDVSAAVAAEKTKGKGKQPEASTLLTAIDEDVEDEAAIINEVSPRAKAAMAAAQAAPDDDPDFAEVAPLQAPSVPRVKVKVDLLDRSQDFGFVSPPCDSMDDPPQLAHFYQNGKYYDANGNRVKMPGDEENDAARAAELERTRKARAVRLRKEAELLDQGLEPETPDEEVESAGVNLTQWALFQRNYRFAEVRKAIQTRYQRVLPTEDEARSFLIDEGVVTEEKVRSAVRMAFAQQDRTHFG